MRVGLLDLDNYRSNKWKFPNLALMKLSAWHKSKGDQTELFNIVHTYDKVYVSKVFDFTEDVDFLIFANEVVYGGVGYGIENDTKLPYHIEHIYPDYGLYGITDVAYGFMSRGCPRNCDFCNVSQHQGSKAVKTADLNEFWNGQKKIVLLDPNITLCKDKYEIMQQLIDSKSTVDFSQGLDIRSMTQKFIKYLNMIKTTHIHFAWDNYEFSTYEKLKSKRHLLPFGRRKYVVYVLINFNTTIDQDIDRVLKLKDLDYWPYVMVYDKSNASILHTKLQRWVNHRATWEKNMSYDEYIMSFKTIPKEYYEWSKSTYPSAKGGE